MTDMDKLREALDAHGKPCFVAADEILKAKARAAVESLFAALSSENEALIREPAEARESVRAMVHGSEELTKRLNAANEARRAEWQPIETAPRDRPIIVWAAPYEGLKGFVTVCEWHPDAGFCVDELRFPTHWMPIPQPPLGGTNEVSFPPAQEGK